MADETPRRGELYRDTASKDLFEVVGIATDANSGGKLVIYRPRGAHPPDMIALDLTRWREALAAGVLALVAGAKP
jgi:hypothetical protein